MADPVKCVLLVDYDGLRRSLAAEAGDDVADRLTGGLDDWAGAIESGELIGPAGATRTLALRRCYINRAEAADAAKAYEQAGFEIVDGDGATSPDLRIAVDAMDAVIDAAGPTDIVLLATAPDLSPLVERLQARGHRVVIYADDSTAADYRAAADVVLGAADFAAFLTEGRLPEAPAAKSAVERGKIEAFAREIHAATSIPLFSPKTFAELFHHLAEEVTASGYHFQDTARNVADRLESSGRNVTPRQVVFVVKGLALKGHVFSTTDTAKSLAEVFREQARYLIGGAGITLDEEREALLAAWIAAPGDRPRSAGAGTPGETGSAEAGSQTARSKARRPAAGQQIGQARRQAAGCETRRAGEAARTPEIGGASAEAVPAAGQARTEIARRGQSRHRRAHRRLRQAEAVEPPAPRRRPGRRRRRRPRRRTSPIRSNRPSWRRSPKRWTCWSRMAAATRRNQVPANRPAPSHGLPTSATPTISRPVTSRREQTPQQTALPSPQGKPPADEDEDGGGDIGDEIQRIIASYNRNRKDDDRGGVASAVGEVLAAVHRHHRAGDEGGVVGGEIGDQRGDLLRLAEPADRNLRDDPFEHLLRHAGDHVGVDIARADALTVMPLRAFSWASALVKPMMPGLRRPNSWPGRSGPSGR